MKNFLEASSFIFIIGGLSYFVFGKEYVSVVLCLIAFLLVLIFYVIPNKKVFIKFIITLIVTVLIVLAPKPITEFLIYGNYWNLLVLLAFLVSFSAGFFTYGKQKYEHGNKVLGITYFLLIPMVVIISLYRFFNGDQKLIEEFTISMSIMLSGLVLRSLASLWQK